MGAFEHRKAMTYGFKELHPVEQPSIGTGARGLAGELVA
jgi:hypothetical protein